MVIHDYFISSNVSYCSLAWHFCSATSTNTLERVQDKALKFINIDYSLSLSKLFSQTKTEPLHVKRLKLMTCEAFKSVNKLSPKYIQDLINIKITPYNFRGERNADLPRVNTTRCGLRSFRLEACGIWNSLLIFTSGRVISAILIATPELRWPWVWMPCVLCLALFLLLLCFAALLCFTVFF